ncbi:MAG: hypothetical protein HYZ75_02830 [Elusimicrobia bacterium]|nr:hypothetical protein [Elusimicrobiota bacterium]
MKTLLSISLAMAAALPACAAEAPGLMSWFKNWKNVLERSVIEGRNRKLRTSTAVAAVRGSGQVVVDPFEPYWKGGWTEKRDKERELEREELAADVGLILDGKIADARAALDAFGKAHPESTFKEDVADARAKLDEMEGKVPAAAEAPAEAKKAPEPEAANAAAEPPKALVEPAKTAEQPAVETVKAAE